MAAAASTESRARTHTQRDGTATKNGRGSNSRGEVERGKGTTQHTCTQTHTAAQAQAPTDTDTHTVVTIYGERESMLQSYADVSARRHAHARPNSKTRSCESGENSERVDGRVGDSEGGAGERAGTPPCIKPCSNTDASATMHERIRDTRTYKHVQRGGERRRHTTTRETATRKHQPTPQPRQRVSSARAELKEDQQEVSRRGGKGGRGAHGTTWSRSCERPGTHTHVLSKTRVVPRSSL